MAVETLGEAYELGWRATARCLLIGPKPKSRTRDTVWCDTKVELDLKTLIWTRGAMFPLAKLESRLKCPKCGQRNVKVMFSVPNQPTLIAVNL